MDRTIEQKIAVACAIAQQLGRQVRVADPQNGRLVELAAKVWQAQTEYIDYLETSEVAASDISRQRLHIYRTGAEQRGLV